jgi:CDP-2,3-bis-(O-geranylgeranyl)-sn-glycerol synthase
MIALLLLVFAANSAPVLVGDLLGRRWDRPVDFGLHLADGRPLLGSSKTWRGLVAGCAASALVAKLLGLTWSIGLAAGTLSMCGDMLASFSKRRIGYAAGDRAPLLDSVPEALLPALGLRTTLALSWTKVLVVVAVFAITVPLVSPLLYKLHIRRRPW